VGQGRFLGEGEEFRISNCRPDDVHGNEFGFSWREFKLFGSNRAALGNYLVVS
jgi:hypothetical protein